MKIRTGDSVVIISGKDKGKQGTVIRVLETDNRLVVEGANMRTRHIKKTPTQAGSKVVYEASIHASNVMIVDPKTKKPTRIGYKIDPKTGKKTRFAKASGEIIAKAAVAKAPKKAAKSEKSDKTEQTAAPAGPIKTPFWKRGSKGGSGDTGGSKASVDTNVIQTAHRAQGG